MKGFTEDDMKILKKHFDADPRLQVLWEKASEFQNARGDIRHAEDVTYFTAVLLEQEKEADAKISLPAAMIHDIGWYWMTQHEQIKGLPYGTAPETVRKMKKKHEELGVKYGRKLLQEAGYQEEEIRMIIEIVDGHDTRVEVLSASDGIVRDADKLARFSKEGFWSVMIHKTGMSKKDRLSALIKQMSNDNYFYSHYSAKIAECELLKRKNE